MIGMNIFNAIIRNIITLFRLIFESKCIVWSHSTCGFIEFIGDEQQNIFEGFLQRRKAKKTSPMYLQKINPARNSGKSCINKNF